MSKLLKRTSILFAVVFPLFVVSCNSGSGEKNAPASGAEPAAAAAPAKDDGQGIGKYKNDEYGSVDDAMAQKGEDLFKQKCSACHKTDGQKVVGPGLGGVTKRRSASWVMNMMTNPVEMTKNDPTGKKLLEEHLTQMTFQDVNDEAAHQILEFLQKNDAK